MNEPVQLSEGQTVETSLVDERSVRLRCACGRIITLHPHDPPPEPTRFGRWLRSIWA